MKIKTLLGGNINEFFIGENNIKFIVHKSLINESTRDMILMYMDKGRKPKDINVDVSGDFIRFEPITYKDKLFLEGDQDYLFFALWCFF